MPPALQPREGSDAGRALTISEASQHHNIPEDAILGAIADGSLPARIDADDLHTWLNSCVLEVTPGPYGPMTLRQVGPYLQWELPVGLDERQRQELTGMLTALFDSGTPDDTWPRLPKSWIDDRAAGPD